jgi:hypothetical protein
MFAADPANLQVGAVGRLDHAAGKPFGRFRNRFGLIGTDRTAIQLDPTDTTIQRLNNT